jgi:hypothetical protein
MLQRAASATHPELVRFAPGWPSKEFYVKRGRPYLVEKLSHFIEPFNCHPVSRGFSEANRNRPVAAVRPSFARPGQYIRVAASFARSDLKPARPQRFRPITSRLFSQSRLDVAEQFGARLY